MSSVFNYLANQSPVNIASKEGDKMDIIRVSGSSRTAAVAGAIAGVFRENRRAVVQAIGASAVNQAVKAIIYATNFLAEDGLEVVFIPEFVDVEIEDKIRTAIKFTVEPRVTNRVAEETISLDSF
jgi:stage V sporulation protein S